MNYTIPRYPLPNNQYWHPILAAGLHKIGTGYIGKGFYIGYNHGAGGKVLFVLQTETDLYEGTYTIGSLFNNHLTLSWNKTEETLNLYVDGVFAASTGKVLQRMQKTPGETFSNYLIVGSGYDYTYAVLYFSIADIAVWKRSLNADEIANFESRGSYLLFLF